MLPTNCCWLKNGIVLLNSIIFLLGILTITCFVGVYYSPFLYLIKFISSFIPSFFNIWILVGTIYSWKKYFFASFFTSIYYGYSARSSFEWNYRCRLMGLHTLNASSLKFSKHDNSRISLSSSVISVCRLGNTSPTRVIVVGFPLRLRTRRPGCWVNGMVERLLWERSRSFKGLGKE